MSLASMPQLVEGQPAHLDVGESLACRVIGFSGPDIVLALLESGGRLQAVRGQIGRPAGDAVVLRLADDTGSASAARSRARRFRCPSASGPAPAATSGARPRRERRRRVRRPRGRQMVDGTLDLRIQVADHEVVAAALAVRVTDAELGRRFDEIDGDDRLLLASLALAYHRRG
jgi:hypothetical protein